MITFLVLILVAATQALTTVIVAHELGQDEYLIYSLISSSGWLFAAIIFEWQRMAMPKIAAMRLGNVAQDIEQTLIQRARVVTYTGVICVCFLSVVLSGKVDLSGVAISSLVGLVGGLSDVYATRVRFGRGAREYINVVLTRAIAQIVVVSLAAHFTGDGKITVVSLLIPSLVSLVVSRAVAPYRGRASVSRRAVSLISKFGFVTALASLLITVTLWLLRLVVVRMAGADTAGFLLLAFDLIQRGSVALGAAISGAQIADLYRSKGAGGRGFVPRAKRVVVRVGAAFCFLYCVGAIVSYAIAYVVYHPVFSLHLLYVTSVAIVLLGAVTLKAYLFDAICALFGDLRTPVITSMCSVVVVGGMCIIPLWPGYAVALVGVVVAIVTVIPFLNTRRHLYKG